MDLLLVSIKYVTFLLEGIRVKGLKHKTCNNSSANSPNFPDMVGNKRKGKIKHDRCEDFGANV